MLIKAISSLFLVLTSIGLFSQTLPPISETPTKITVEGQYHGKWWDPLPTSVMNRIIGKSWNEDCPVPLTDFSYIQVSYWNYQDQISTGEMVVHKNLAQEVVDIFGELFEAKFPIAKMVLIDDYDANDDLSLGENNSSALCSRRKVGKSWEFSLHSYGGTIDINPIQNPYVKGDVVLPPEGKIYLNRTQDMKGMIKEEDSCYQAFVKRGYQWGGHYQTLKDYQHFEKQPEAFIPLSIR